MAIKTKNPYVPGMYARKQLSTHSLVERYLREWEKKRQLRRKAEGVESVQTPHYICFSRKIGVGAVEIADILAERIGWKVVDREIMEHIAEERSLSNKTLELFDEKYPGSVNNFASMMFGEKSFTMGDYMRTLTELVSKIAATGPTIFVGRATHLMLPRDNVLAVRLIASRERRADRVAAILDISVHEAEKIIDREDKLQREFFKKNFGKKDAPPHEFDLVINRDYVEKALDAAELVHRAYMLKFGTADHDSKTG